MITVEKNIPHPDYSKEQLERYNLISIKATNEEGQSGFFALAQPLVDDSQFVETIVRGEIKKANNELPDGINTVNGRDIERIRTLYENNLRAITMRIKMIENGDVDNDTLLNMDLIVSPEAKKFLKSYSNLLKKKIKCQPQPQNGQ